MKTKTIVPDYVLDEVLDRQMFNNYVEPRRSRKFRREMEQKHSSKRMNKEKK